MTRQQKTLPMTAHVIYQGQLRTEATHLRSGERIITDAPLDNQGKGEAFSPTDLVATALAACMLTVMGIKARDKGWDMDGARAEVIKDMAAAPRRIGRVALRIVMPATGLSEEAKQVLEKTGRTCPVAQSLSADLEQDVHFEWL